MDKQLYLDFARKIAENSRNTYALTLASAKSRAAQTGEYQPMNFINYLLRAETGLFVHQGDQTALTQAVRLLTDYAEFLEEFPLMARQHGHEVGEHFPTLNWMFGPVAFLWSFDRLKDHLPPALETRLERGIEDGINTIFCFPEYGAHNRTALRGANMLCAARFLPDSPYAGQWKRFGNRLLEESLGKWSTEDAGTYNPVWFAAMVRAAEFAGREEELFAHPVTRFYAEYYLQLVCPLGVIPDFGDARWGSCWGIVCSVFEKLASVYRDERFKWAAGAEFRAISPLDDGTAPLTVKMAESYLDAYEWADDALGETRPSGGSREVLEDVIGKKVVFRSGWTPEDTYLLLNYRDETNVSFLPKYNMKNTINIHPEKTHHGHSDENALALLVSGGSVLLHDGGYRPGSHAVVNNREWRADFYHNNVVIRRGINLDGLDFLDYVRNDGDYFPVKTEKIYFYAFEKADLARTRREDLRAGAEHDRCICYLKEENVFIVIDFVKSLQAQSLTCGAQYFSRVAEKVGTFSFLTRYDYLGSDEHCARIPNNPAQNLLISFPLPHRLETKEISRSYTMETSVADTVSRYFMQNEFFPLVSVLTPCRPDCDAVALEEGLSASFDGKGVTVTLKKGGKTITVGCRADLEAGVIDLNHRPSFTYQAAKTAFGSLETDAFALYAEEEARTLSYAFVDGTRLDRGGKNLFGVEPCLTLQKDKRWTMEISPWFCGEDRVTL